MAVRIDKNPGGDILIGVKIAGNNCFEEQMAQVSNLQLTNTLEVSCPEDNISGW